MAYTEAGFKMRFKAEPGEEQVQDFAQSVSWVFQYSQMSVKVN